MFSHGAIFGTHDLGKPAVKEGTPFSLAVRRSGDVLTIDIDGKSVHSAELHTTRRTHGAAPAGGAPCW